MPERRLAAYGRITARQRVGPTRILPDAWREPEPRLDDDPQTRSAQRLRYGH